MLQVNTGEAWYQKLLRELRYFTMRNFPSAVIGKMMSQFTPTFADEAFMAEVTKQMETSLWFRQFFIWQ